MITPEIRQAIEDLMHEYVHCIDDDGLERWPTLFASQCLYKVVPRENADLNLPIAIMFCDSQGMLLDRVTAHRKANLFAAHFYRHIVSSIRVIGEEHGIWSVRANYVVFRTAADAVQYGATEMYSAGAYRDKVVFEDGVAKFREKIVVADTCKVSSLLVTPL
ncbi:MAG: aromatic-ring-hydroxylating dioxygenase subunit beta [Deltaproteobacteria bacterium]|nr:aromatic-ring-hydroxylating dioxygenase subunit beta [Deltaproteobacteria bacterium]